MPWATISPARDITAGEIAAALGSWRGTLSEGAINRRLGCLQRIWRRAQEQGRALHDVPWRRLRLHEPEQGDQSIPPIERAAFLAALPLRTRRLFLFGLLTGLRRGGMLAIDAAQVDRKAGVIHTRSKGRAGGKLTPVPITPRLEALLDEMGVPEVGRLFALTPGMIRRDVAKARAATGLHHVQIRRTRHSFAQDLEDAGFGDAISDALHHSDPRLRRRYSRARIERLADVLRKVQGED